MLVKMGLSSPNRGENKKYLKAPPRYKYIYIYVCIYIFGPSKGAKLNGCGSTSIGFLYFLRPFMADLKKRLRKGAPNSFRIYMDLTSI